MASELRVTTIANNAGTESVDTTYVINGSAKAWVRSNQSTISESQSFNVSSSTDHGTGDYSHTLTNALDTRGQLVATVRRNSNGIGIAMNEDRDSASVMAVRSYNGSTSTDTRAVCVYFGDLA